MEDLEDKIKQAILKAVGDYYGETKILPRTIKAEFMLDQPDENNNCSFKGAVTVFCDDELNKMSALEYAIATRIG